MEIYFLDEKGTVSGAEKAVEERENKDVGAPSGMAKDANPLLKTILTDISRNTLEDYQYESYLACRRVMEAFGQMTGYPPAQPRHQERQLRRTEELPHARRASGNRLHHEQG